MNAQSGVATLLFHHIPKTAGTSVVDVLRANYGAGLHTLYEPGELERARRAPPAERTARLGFTPEMRCVATHGCELVIPALPANYRAIALLRHPVERVISLFYYARSIAESDRGQGGEVGRFLLERGWQLADIYERLSGGWERKTREHQIFWDFFNGQARHLLRPHAPTGRIRFGRGLPVCADEFLGTYQMLVQQRYRIGIQEEFERSLERFARAFAWRTVEFPRKRATPGRPNAADIPEETRRLIVAHNQLDLELWRRARAALLHAD